MSEDISKTNAALADLNSHNFLLRRAEDALEENVSLKEKYNKSIDMLTKSVEEKLKDRIAAAKQMKKIAIESQDVDQQVNMDEELADAVTDYKAFEGQKETYSSKVDSESREKIDKEHMRQRWLSSNENILRDRDFAEEIQNRSLHLESRMINSGQENLIYSPEYFKVMDRIKNDLLTERQRRSEVGRSGMRRSSSSSSSSSKETKLDEDEIEYLQMTGIDPKKFVAARQRLGAS